MPLDSTELHANDHYSHFREHPIVKIVRDTGSVAVVRALSSVQQTEQCTRALRCLPSYCREVPPYDTAAKHTHKHTSELRKTHGVYLLYIVSTEQSTAQM